MRIRRTSRVPRGLTIAELLVALVLLVVGVLAAAGTAGRLARSEREARDRADAAAALSERVERVAASPCADSAGSRIARGVTEWWRTSSAGGALWLADSARWHAPDGAHVVGTWGAAACAR